MRRREALLTGALAGLGLVACGRRVEPPPPPATGAGAGPISGLPWHSGVCRGNVVDSFERWRSRPVDSVTIWGKFDSWYDVAGGGDDDQLSGYFSHHWPGVVDCGRPLAVSWPLLPKSADARQHPESWPDGARGLFDASYVQFARKLQRLLEGSGRHGCVVRINWEGNGGFYPHSINGQVDAWRSTFRRAADIFRRHVLGAVIDWSNVPRGRAGGGNASIFPGADWVDVIGLDLYDWLPASPSEDQWEANSRRHYRGGPYGVRTWLEFAQSEGKPLSLPEWGVMTNLRKHARAGGDNPVFIAKTFEFIRANEAFIAYENYFDMSDSRVSADSSAPLSAKAYRQRWQAA